MVLAKITFVGESLIPQRTWSIVFVNKTSHSTTFFSGTLSYSTTIKTFRI